MSSQPPGSPVSRAQLSSAVPVASDSVRRSKRVDNQRDGPHAGRAIAQSLEAVSLQREVGTQVHAEPPIGLVAQRIVEHSEAAIAVLVHDGVDHIHFIARIEIVAELEQRARFRGKAELAPHPVIHRHQAIIHRGDEHIEIALVAQQRCRRPERRGRGRVRIAIRWIGTRPHKLRVIYVKGRRQQVRLAWFA